MIKALKAIECDTGTPRDRKYQRQVIYWSFAWMASWLGTHWAISRDWLAPGWPAGLATLVSTLLGVAVFFVYRRSLQEADELRRKIELDALGVAFGVGIVGGMAYFLAHRAGLVAETDPLVIFTAMMGSYGLAVVAGHLRYR